MRLFLITLLFCAALSMPAFAQSNHAFTFYQRPNREPVLKELDRMIDSLEAKHKIADTLPDISSATADSLKDMRKVLTKLRHSIQIGFGPITLGQLIPLKDVVKKLEKLGLNMKLASYRDSKLSPSLQTTNKDDNLLTSLRPAIFYGGAYNIWKGKDMANTSASVKVGAFVSTPPPQDNENEYLRALMMPGAVNVIASFNVGWEKNKNFKVTLAATAGLKFQSPLPDSADTSGADSSQMITDEAAAMPSHSLALGAAFQVWEKVLIYGQLVEGFHNISSKSEENFKTVFNRPHTEFNYWFLGFQFALGDLGGQQSFMYLEWRSLMGADEFDPGGRFGESRFLTFGFRNEIDI